jgi:hypothetical protein
MVRVGQKLLIFGLPLVLVWGVLEWWAAKIPNSDSIKRFQLERLAETTDTLILGSSTAYFGIAPKQLSGSAYNLANVGQPLYYDDGLVTRASPALPRLKRVIVGINYMSFFTEARAVPEIWRQYYYQQAWHIPPPRFQDRLDIRMWSHVALQPLPVIADSLRTALGAYCAGRDYIPRLSDPNIDERGWWCQGNHVLDLAQLSSAAAENQIARYHRVMRLASEPANLACLDHLISLLQARNVEVVLVTTPVRPAYSDRMKPKYWERTQLILRQMTLKYGVRYISFLHTPEMTTGDFRDADHLSRRGAIRFTTLLNSALQCKSPNLVVENHPGLLPQDTSRNP